MRSQPRNSTHVLIEALEARIAPAFASSIDLGALDGSDGFKVSGFADDETAGVVSDAGDVNGDGFGDIIIGSPGSGTSGKGSGSAYVVFGRAGGPGASLSLSALDGTNGFKLSGVVNNYSTGASVSGAGDVNGDGFADLIVGAPDSDEGGFLRGVAYVVFGKPDFSGTAGTLALSALDGTNGFKLSGLAEHDYAGGSVSGAGDVNGDGFADFIVGASRADEGGTDRGAAYVVFGKADFSSTAGALALSALNGTNGFKLSGVADRDYAGISVSRTGDVNGDGLADLIVGASRAHEGGNEPGAAYVVFGRADFSSTAGALALSALNGINGLKLSGAANFDRAGGSVSRAGDVNGDGLADLIVGATGADEGGTDRGAAYLVFGKADFSGTAGTLALSALNGTNGFKLSGVANSDRAGDSVSGAGDVNGDGLADLIVGATGADEGGTDRGTAYVVFGKADFSGTAGTLALSAVSGANGFKLSGVADRDDAGISVSGAGDVNGDGVADLIVGAARAAEGGFDRGASYVVFGQPDVAVKFSNHGKTATFLDGDSDLVTVKVSKGALRQGDFTFSGSTWRKLDLSDPAKFTGTNVTVTVKKKLGGDGKVNLGALNATGVDLGAVKLPGDLGQVDAGDAIVETPAIKSLSVGSLGVVAGTQPVNVTAPLVSNLVGSLKALTVKGAMKGAIDITGGAAAGLGTTTIAGDLDGSGAGGSLGRLKAEGSIGNVTIKGSILGGVAGSGITAGGALRSLNVTGDIVGGAATSSGQILATGTMGSITVGGDIVGGAGSSSGRIRALDTLAKVKVGGSVLGGTGNNSAEVRSDGDMGKVTVIGSVQGGSGDSSGRIRSSGSLESLSIGDSLRGGSTSGAGQVFVNDEIGPVAIGGDVLGGSISRAGTLINAGLIQGQSIAKVTIGGSLIAGTASGGGVLQNSAAIRAEDHLGPVVVKGNISGNASHSVLITARGQAVQGAKSDVAIKSLTVTGAITNARILAGYDTTASLPVGVNGDAQIGAVSAGLWAASSLVAGVEDGNADGFGRNDNVIAGGKSEIIASIASVVIKGSADGSSTVGSFFGITAERIVKLKVGAIKHPLTLTPNDILLDTTNANFRAVDFA